MEEMILEIEVVENCPACGKNDFRKLSNITSSDFGNYLSKSICNNCSTIFSSKRPSFSWALKNLYSHTVLNSIDIESPIEKRRIKRYENIAKFVKSFTNSRSILDVGSGTGIGLIGFDNAGLKVTGLEPDGRSKALEAYSSIEIINKTIEDYCSHNNKKHELISIIHVLEHIYNPKSILQSVSNALPEHGLLYIEVPDQNNFRFSDLTHVAHCTYFNYHSLVHICNDFQLSPVGRLFPKTQPFGDTHLGILFKKNTIKNHSNNNKLKKQNIENSSIVKMSPVVNKKNKLVEIITPTIKNNITDFQNYRLISHERKHILMYNENARSLISVLTSKFLSTPVFFLRSLILKFLSKFLEDKKFDSFEFDRII